MNNLYLCGNQKAIKNTCSLSQAAEEPEKLYETLSYVMKDLGTSGYTIWTYLVQFPIDEFAPLYNKLCIDYTGLGKSTYYRVIPTLIEKGYLVETENENYFEFHHLPYQSKN